MQTHALINVYNDHVILPLTLSSVKDIVDSIVVADGAYQAYYPIYKRKHPDAEPWSTDGTLEILKIIPDLPPIKLIEAPDGEPWENQCVKRTALLDAVPEGDWFIVLDSDEMLYGDVEDGLNEIMSSGCIAGCMPIYNPGLDVSRMLPVWHPRVFLKLEGMHYARKHWVIRDWANRVVEADYPTKWTDQFVLAHLKVFKHRGRLLPHMGYMRKMSLDGWMEPYREPKHFNIK